MLAFLKMLYFIKIYYFRQNAVGCPSRRRDGKKPPSLCMDIVKYASLHRNAATCITFRKARRFII